MLQLKRVVEVLKEDANNKRDVEIFLPLLWDSIESEHIISKDDRQFRVKPYLYIAELIEKVYLNVADQSVDYHLSIQKANKTV